MAAEVGGNDVAGDVTEPEDCQRAVDQAAEGGTLRIAVNCAGTGWVGRVINRDGSPHDLERLRVHPAAQRHRHLQRHDQGRLGHGHRPSRWTTASAG